MSENTEENKPNNKTPELPAELFKFSLEEELEQLRKRQRELRDIELKLEDFHDWFKKNQSRMSSSVDFSELEAAILVIGDLRSDIEDESEIVEEAILGDSFLFFSRCICLLSCMPAIRNARRKL